MDRQIRELERLAATGDLEAQERLKQIWIRNRLVPSDDELLLMRCGMAQGNDSSVQFFIDLWKHIVGILIENVSHSRMHLAQIANAPDEEFEAIEDARLQFEAQLRDIIIPPPQHNLIEHLALQFNDILEYINYELEERDTAPIYINYNDLSDSLTLAYLDPASPMQDPVKLYTTLRCFKQYPKIHRKKGADYETDIYWMVGSFYDEARIEYRPPLTRDQICATSFIMNLPCALQDYPVWKAWAYGDCDPRRRDFMRYHYFPIKENLASMHWLKLPSENS